MISGGGIENGMYNCSILLNKMGLCNKYTFDTQLPIIQNYFINWKPVQSL